MDDAPMLRLRPDRLLATGWGAFGLVAVALGWGQLVIDLSVFALVFSMTAIGVAGYFLLQAAVPAQFEVVIDTVGVRGRWLWRRLQVPWTLVAQAQVDDVAGESFLKLRLVPGQEVSLLLPYGSDVAALHDALAANLGADRSR